MDSPLFDYVLYYQPTRAKSGAALQTASSLIHYFINSFSNPSVPTTLWRRYTQTVRDRSSMYKLGYVIGIKNFFNPEGHQNCISGSKVTAILLKGWILPIAGASAGESLCLQPAQQACFLLKLHLIEETFVAQKKCAYYHSETQFSIKTLSSTKL